MDKFWTLFLAFGLVYLTTPAWAQSWSARGDFSVAANPNGAWSYGAKSSQTSAALSLYGSTTSVGCAACTIWFLGLGGACYPWVCGDSNYHPVALFMFPANSSNTPATTSDTTRWTAPVAGVYQLTATFELASQGGPTSIGVGIVVDGVVLPGSATTLSGISGTHGPITASFSLPACSTIDFVIDDGGNWNGADFGFLQAQIDTISTSGIALDITQPGGAGASAFAANSGLVSGHEYYNIFSFEPCAGGPGSGPANPLGLCLGPPDSVQFVVDQLLMPVGVDPWHFIAGCGSTNFGPYTVGPVTLDAVCFEVTGGVVGEVSPVVRFTIQ